MVLILMINGAKNRDKIFKINFKETEVEFYVSDYNHVYHEGNLLGFEDLIKASCIASIINRCGLTVEIVDIETGELQKSVSKISLG